MKRLMILILIVSQASCASHRVLHAVDSDKGALVPTFTPAQEMVGGWAYHYPMH